MKAGSKAHKRRKGGRPKTPDVTRTPSGQISRAGDAQVLTNLELEVATWRRRRENPGVKPEEARKQEYGSVIHQWLAESNGTKQRAPGGTHQNLFTQQHFDTAQRFMELRERYLTAMDVKRMRSSSEFGRVGGHPPDVITAEAKSRDERTIDEFKKARNAVLYCGAPLGMMAIETIVIENQPAFGMIGDLRQALNALATLWRLQSAA